MNDTAKNTSTDVPPLSWTGKKVWGAVGNTYHAEADGWRYTVDQPRKGQWVLRGWGPDGAFLYRDCFTTMKAAKAAAGEHRDEYLAAKMADGVPDHQYSDSCPGTCCGGDEPQQVELVDEGAAVLALAALPAAAMKVADGMRDALAPMVNGMTLAVRSFNWYHRRSCACPTPLHTMRCGQGARPVVRQPERLRKPCTECGRVTNHKLDCSKGRA